MVSVNVVHTRTELSLATFTHVRKGFVRPVYTVYRPDTV
jgi:hypothetical protein